MTNLYQINKIKWAYNALVVLIVWFSLVLQFAVSIPAYLAAGRTLAGALVMLFSYFTILSNILMVVCLTIILTAPKSAWGRFFSKNTVITSITFYMVVVGLIYNILLRNIVQLEGLFKLANELLHVVNPLLLIIYWLFFVPKDGLKLKAILTWLWYPFIYFVYSVIRGAISGDYPYPFLNVAKFGFTRVMINAVILLPLFWILGALFIILAQYLHKKRITAS
ncbi:Pr6Pr family membrane protein [Mucilaginibacter sp.]|uniref:Pr6Pr family membrane protein n=1 Tax=Mucilaginibacter sp. TaxID=1882438 RepID=UPI003D141149